MKTIRPYPAAAITGSASSVARTAVHRLRSIVACSVSSVCSSVGRMTPPPALLTSTSIRPSHASISSPPAAVFAEPFDPPPAPLDHSPRGRGIAEVAGDRRRAVPRERLQVAEHELCALGLHAARDPAADRAAGARDHRRAPLEAAHHTNPGGGCGPHTFQVVGSAGS